MRIFFSDIPNINNCFKRYPIQHFTYLDFKGNNIQTCLMSNFFLFLSQQASTLIIIFLPRFLPKLFILLLKIESYNKMQNHIAICPYCGIRKPQLISSQQILSLPKKMLKTIMDQEGSEKRKWNEIFEYVRNIKQQKRKDYQADKAKTLKAQRERQLMSPQQAAAFQRNRRRSQAYRFLMQTKEEQLPLSERIGYVPEGGQILTFNYEVYLAIKQNILIFFCMRPRRSLQSIMCDLKFIVEKKRKRKQVSRYDQLKPLRQLCQHSEYDELYLQALMRRSNYPIDQATLNVDGQIFKLASLEQIFVCSSELIFKLAYIDFQTAYKNPAQQNKKNLGGQYLFSQMQSKLQPKKQFLRFSFPKRQMNQNDRQKYFSILKKFIDKIQLK